MNWMVKIASQSRIIAWIIVIVAFIHRLYGDSRWQYSPLYFVGLLYITIFSLEFLNVLTVGPRLSKWLIGLGLLFILLTVFFVKAFRKVEMLEPTGEFQVGTQTFEVEDQNRVELYREDEKNKRRIKYQVWYPAKNTEHLKPVKWLSDGVLVPRTLLKHTLLPAPPFLLDYTAEIDANAYANAALSPELENYPVIVISHGWRGFRELHTDFAEDLASHGYIAVSIDHTYGSEAVKFADGSVATLNPDALPRVATPSVFSEKAHKLAITYGKDVSLVLDDLERLAKEDATFKGKLDLEHIGLLGHSTGGAGDVFISLRDDRVKALIGMDAWVNPLDLAELKEGLPMPSLFMRSKQWSIRESKIPLNVLVKNSGNAKIIDMEQTKHLDFPMIYMLSPYTKYVGLTGRKGGRESSIIQREIVRNFYDEHLRNEKFSEEYLELYLKDYEHLWLSDI